MFIKFRTCNYSLTANSTSTRRLRSYPYTESLKSTVYLYILLILFSVSNEVPEHPVVSPVSGSIFERRLIEKYIKENNTDPINGEELALEQLVDIKSKLKSSKNCTIVYI